MTAFAPVYRPRPHQKNFLERQERQERKRKRLRGSDGEQDAPAVEPADNDNARPAHPVSLTDPYFVAGHSREDPLPGGNFPHAPLGGDKWASVTAKEELAKLNPHVYVPVDNPREEFIQRHVNNLHLLLHKCMTENDWKRASRIFGIIIRCKLDGDFIDVRRSSLWAIGAEIIMRRTQPPEDPDWCNEDGISSITDEGFKTARDHYERLIVQYPHEESAHHDSVDALVFYPALFSVWIFEVVNRGRARRARASDDSSEMDILKSELAEAQPILKRLEELSMSPPYDINVSIQKTRGYLASWISDLHMKIADTDDDDSSVEEHRTLHLNERRKAKQIFQTLSNKGVDLPGHVVRFIAKEI